MSLMTVTKRFARIGVFLTVMVLAARILWNAALTMIRDWGSPDIVADVLLFVVVAVVGGCVVELVFEFTIKKLVAEDVVTKVVGIHPDQLPAWKWREVATPRADQALAQIAHSLQLLDKREMETLKNTTAEPVQILEFDRVFKRKKKEFHKIRDAFKMLGVNSPYDSWKDYPPPIS